jgi:hypothetical protein
MSSSHHRVPLEAGLPIATISGEQRLVFASNGDFDHAWDVGIFYLRIPENLDLDDARQFGRKLISLDSAYRQIVQYGKLEGFIALENNQQTKLALRRARWDQHYPADVAAFGRQLDTIGIAIIREVFNQSGIPEALWDRASGGYTSGGVMRFLISFTMTPATQTGGCAPTQTTALLLFSTPVHRGFKSKSTVSFRPCRFSQTI